MIAPRPAHLQCVLDRLCLLAKTSFLKFLVFLFVCSLAAVRNADGKEADAAAVERLRGSVEFLAADDQEGRGVGTAGLNKAADYIRERFAEFGLKMDAVEGGAYQPFEIPWKTELGPKEQNRLVLIPPSKDGQAPKITELVLDRDFTPMGDGGTGKVTAPIIFAGYGITAKDEDYDDYANVDVKDRIVLILRREPQQNNPHSVFNGTENSDYALFRLKVSNAYEHGAAALIIVNDAYSLSQDLKKQRDRLSETFEKLSAEKAAFAELKSPTIAQFHAYADKLASLAKNFETLATNLSKPVDSLIPFQEGGGTNPRKMPVLFAKREFFNEAISASFEGKSLEEIEQEIDGELKPLSRELSGWQIEAETNIIRLKADVKNVIGVLPGQGELAKQVVIVGAHYDHVGMGGAGSGSLAPWTSEIHNGADDNASGSAGLLEIARSLAGLKAENHRTIVFIAFTAEERGLLGSNYYVQHPIFPLEQTVAMVNLDMIGRLKDNKLIVYGTGTAKTFDKLIDDVNKDYDFEIVKKPTGYGPSDHESFYSKKIPVFHMFTGLHQDYHRPSDDFDKLDYAAIAKIAEMVSVVVEDLATVKDRPEYVAIGRERGGLAEQSGLRAYFGSQPDFAAEAEGYAISGTSNGSPAEKAGLKGGDVIIKLEDSRIGGLEDFDSALRKYKPGEKVKVIVLRDGKEMTFDVTLEER